MNNGVLTRTGFAVAALVSVSCLGAMVLDGEQTRRHRPHPPADERSDESRDPTSPLRLREGSVVTDQPGEFKRTADGVTFLPAGAAPPFRMLENLALERVWHLLDDTHEHQWTVSGVVTEYRGANYLLLTRAVLRASPAKTPTDP
ncbi:MAG: hypothetical protein FJ276_16855 [Planctomycetes bacterium]|nr:hypothetical protein [Planctomycetota bacterium]